MVEEINNMNGVQSNSIRLFSSNPKANASDNSIFAHNASAELNTQTTDSMDLNRKVKNLRENLKDSVPKVSDKFLADTVKISEQIHCNPEDLLAIMYHESAGWNPSCIAKNKQGQIAYGGLIQMNSTSLRTVSSKYAKELGLNPKITMNSYLKLPREEQLKYVQGYLMLMKDSCNLNREPHLTAGETWGMIKSPKRTRNRDKTFLQRIEAHLKRIKQKIFKTQPSNHLNISKA